ncbi:terminase [Clostridia bacterium]|nr:terminase [Clostridia bacterium]
MSNAVFDYHAAIRAGTVTVGKWIIMIYDILVDGLLDGKYIFDGKRADKAIRFIENFCHHNKGREDLIKLELWQKAAVSAIFGVVDSSGLRVWREVFIVVARKNGKTLLAAAIIACIAYMDGEYGAEIYCVATKLDQASIVYNDFYQIVKKSPDLLDLSHKRRSEIYIEDSNTTIKPLPFNAKKSEGYNAHLVVNDEIASWRGDNGLKQYEAMKSSFGSRKQPFILSISTAGFENDGIFDELMNRSTKFLKGNSRENQLLPLLYMVDDAEKWNDIDELKKANPNMDVSVPQNYFREEIIIAENSASRKTEFLTKYCNVKQNSSVAWLEFALVEAASADVKLEDFRGCYAVGGIDLSQTTDLTAATACIERGGNVYTFTHFFMPASRIEFLQQKDGVPYDLFVKKGIITPSGENHVDYKDVVNWFVTLREKYEIYPLQIGYDLFSAQYLVDDLNNYGFHTDDVRQGENLTPVILEFEGILRDGRFKIADNPLLKAHFLNVALKHNAETRRFRPVKIEQRLRIDGFVSVIDALTVRQKYYAEIGEMLRNGGDMVGAA